MSGSSVVVGDPAREVERPTEPAGTGSVRFAVWRSPAGQPGWARPALLMVAAAATVVYGWGIHRMQLQMYYGPAVKSMAGSWRGFLYGGYDPAVSVTLDKVPGAFWSQALSARVFGFGSWSVLLPQVLASVATILVLYRVVRRWVGPVAGLAAAVAFAVTPMVAALARTQIADTVLVLLLVLAVDAWQRAVAGARLVPLLVCGAWVGLAFHAKMAQAFAVLPVFGIAYLLAAPTTVRRRLGQLALAGGVTVAVSAAWIALVLLTPASARPYVDGSVDDSPVSMVFGYNGLNRYGIDNGGAEALGVGGPLGRSHGSPWLYMTSDAVAPQVGWLYPLALLGLGWGLAARSRGDRPDRAPGGAMSTVRAGYLMWGLWLLVHAVSFGISQKPHTFYVVAVAPAVAALAGAAVPLLWSAYRRGGRQQWLLPAAVAVTAGWAAYVGAQFPAYSPWITPTLLALGAVAVVTLVVARLGQRRPAGTPLAVVGGVLAIVTVLLAPAAWAVSVMDNTDVVHAHRPAGGPAGRETATVLSGRMPRLLPDAEVDRLTAYLKANARGEKYQLAVQWAPQAGRFILADMSVLPVGGFTAQVPTISSRQLTDLVASAELRYALLDGPATRGRVTPDYPDYAEWTQRTCTPVEGFSHPLYVLHDCRP